MKENVNMCQKKAAKLKATLLLIVAPVKKLAAKAMAVQKERTPLETLLILSRII